MSMDDNDGQMIFGDHGSLKLPDICLTGEEKPRKNLTQETCPDRGSNPGPLRDKRACCHLLHSGGRETKWMSVEKWWNEICGTGKQEKPREKPTQTPFRPPRNPHGVTET